MSGLSKKLGLMLGGLVVALIAAEIILRVIGFGVLTPDMSFGMNTRSALEQGDFEPDGHLFWKLPLNQNPAFDQAIGAVHPDKPIRAKGNRERVLVLGDSCSRLSFRSLPYSDALLIHLAGDTEVLNASVPGYTSHQGLAWWRHQLRDASPDVVVVYFGWNDHWRMTGWTDRLYARRISGWSPRLFALVEQPADPPPLRVPPNEYRENLRDLVDGIRDAGGRAVLVVAPSSFTPEARRRLVDTGYLRPDDDVREIHEQYLDVVRSFAGEENVSVLGADQVFRDLGSQIPLLQRDGIHLTDAAHHVLGALLAQTIRHGTGADGQSSSELLGVARAALGAAVRRAGEGS